jgi:hypothetical protein
MTNSISSAAANGKSVGNSTLIQKDPIKQIKQLITPAASELAKPLGTAIAEPQNAIVASPAVRLNLSSYAQSNLLTPQASPLPQASVAPANLSMSMGASQTLGYDQQGSVVQSLTSPTNQVKITVNLVKGVTYNLQPPLLL